jgi:hypothetical protein
MKKDFRSMASSVQAYQISIANTTVIAPGNGFIDNLRIEQYGLNFETTPAGLTYLLSQAKRRGNMRYREIILQLSIVTNCYVPPQSIVSDATAITEATAFAFQIYIERGAGSLVTNDELNAGVQLTGVDCIVRCIARALALNLPIQTDVLDPTSATSTGVFGATASVPRYGSRINVASSFDVGPYATTLLLAEAQVTVAAI